MFFVILRPYKQPELRLGSRDLPYKRCHHCKREPLWEHDYCSCSGHSNLLDPKRERVSPSSWPNLGKWNEEMNSSWHKILQMNQMIVNISLTNHISFLGLEFCCGKFWWGKAAQNCFKTEPRNKRKQRNVKFIYSLHRFFEWAIPFRTDSSR